MSKSAITAKKLVMFQMTVLPKDKTPAVYTVVVLTSLLLVQTKRMIVKKIVPGVLSHPIKGLLMTHAHIMLHHKIAPCFRGKLQKLKAIQTWIQKTYYEPRLQSETCMF